MNHASGKASNAVLAKARALYGRRLRAEDYRRLTDCHTMTELANELKALPLYANTLAEVNPTYARRAQLENLLRQSQYERFDSLCRYDRTQARVYQYLTLCCGGRRADRRPAVPGCRPPRRLPVPPAGLFGAALQH